MAEKNEFENICSISQMAARLNLSRPRFYQLRKSGVFPPPVYSLRTKRPFYPFALQKICIRIYETGIGLDGQPVLFYKPREKQAKQKSKMPPKEHFNAYREWGVNPQRVGHPRNTGTGAQGGQIAVPGRFAGKSG